MNIIFYILSFVYIFNTHCDFCDSVYNSCLFIKNTIINGFNFASQCGENKAKAEILDKVSNTLISIPAPNAGGDVVAAVATTASSVNDISNITNEIQNNSKVIVDSVEKVGGGIEKVKDVVTPASEAFRWYCIIGSTVTIVQGTYDFGCWSRKTFFPTEDEKIAKERESLELKKFRAERDLTVCLAKNKLHARRNGSLPSDCDVAAQLFAQLAGFRALNEMQDEYLKHVRRHP